jgi:GT2 family glycosyltransferase
MVRREAIDRVGRFDGSFWMYCEEIEWCWRFQRHGWRISYLPDVEIVHHEGASTSQNVPRRQLAFDRSRIELQRRLYGGPTAAIAKAGIKLGYAIQMSVEGLKWTLGHRRDLRGQRVLFYRTLLFSSMRFEENQSR